MAGHHDLGYKLLFAHPELMCELLAGFTPFPWLDGLDAAAFERVNPSYVSDGFSERHDDIVWRVRLGGQWLYVYVLLEFQSGIDRWMALRMQVYVGLLYQDLVKRGELVPEAMLPAVLPLVFYNGRAAWSASQDLGSLIAPAPAGLADVQASQRYFLIDQCTLDPAALAENRSILALLFRLELSELPDVVADILPLLATWLSVDAQAPLRRDVALWVEQLLSREFKGEQVLGAWNARGGDAMRGRKFETWTDAVEDRGRQQGLEQGLERGLEQGLERGLEQGLERGLEQTREKMRGILTHLLIRRYGELPVGADAKIGQASIEELNTWIDRAIDADSIDALFGAQAPPRQAPLTTFWAS